MRRNHFSKTSHAIEDHARRYRLLSEVRRNKTLTAWARLIYAELDDLAGPDKNTAHPKQTTLAEILGVSLRTIKRGLRELRENQIIETGEPQARYCEYRIIGRSPAKLKLVKPQTPPPQIGELVMSISVDGPPTAADLTRKKHLAHGPEFKCCEEFGTSDLIYACHRWRCQCGWTSEWYSVRMALPILTNEENEERKRGGKK